MSVSRRHNGVTRENFSPGEVDRNRAVTQFSKTANAIDDLGGGALLNTCDKLFALFTRRSLETTALMDRMSGFSAKHSPWNGNLVDAVEMEMNAISSERRALEEAFFELGDIAKRWNLEKATLEEALFQSRKEEAEVKELFMQMCSEASHKLTVARDTSVMREGTTNRRVSDLHDRIKELELEMFVVHKDKEEGEALNRTRYDQLQTELQRALSVSAAVRRQWMNKLRKVSERRLLKSACKDPFTRWKNTVHHEQRITRTGLKLQKSQRRKAMQHVFSAWKEDFLEDSVNKQFQKLQRSKFSEQADRLMKAMVDDSGTESLHNTFTVWKWCASASARGHALEHMSQSFSTCESGLLKEIGVLRSVTDTFTARESEQVQKIEALQSQIDSFSIRECELVQQIEVLKSQTDSFTAVESELLQQVESLQSQTDTFTVREAELLQQVASLQSQTDTFTVREAELLQQAATLQSQTDTFTVREAELLQQVASLQSQTDTFTVREAELLQQVASFQSQTDTFTVREAELLQQVASLQSQTHTFTVREAELLQQVASFQSQTDTSTVREAELLQQQAASLQSQTDTFTVREAELIQQVANLHSKAASSTVREAEMVQQIEVLKARADTFTTREAELLREMELLKSHAGTAERQSLPEQAAAGAVSKETEEDVTCVRSQDGHDTNSCTTEEQGRDDAHDPRMLDLQKDASLAILSNDMQFVQEAVKLVLSTIRKAAQLPEATDVIAAEEGGEGFQKVDEPGILGLAFDDELIVIDIVTFSPADDCGRISVGDRLVSINGKEQVSSQFTREEAASELFGPAGSVAEIVVEHADGGREHCTLLRTSKAEVLSRWSLRKDFETLSQYVGGRAAGAVEGAQLVSAEGVQAQLETALQLNEELTREREDMSKKVSALRSEREQSLRSVVEFGENLELVEGILEQLEVKVVHLSAVAEGKRGDGRSDRMADESSILHSEKSYDSSNQEVSFCEQSPLKDQASTLAHLSKILKIRNVALGGEAVSINGESTADMIIVLVQTLVFVLETATGKKLDMHDEWFSGRKPTMKEAVGELQAVVEGLEMVANNAKSWRRSLRNWMATLKRMLLGVILGAMLSCYLGQHGIVNMNECSARLPTLDLSKLPQQLRDVDLQEWKGYAQDSLVAVFEGTQNLLHTHSRPEETGTARSKPASGSRTPPKARAGWFSGSGKK